MVEAITEHGGLIQKDGGKAYKLEGGIYDHGRLEIDLSKGDASLYIAGDSTFKSFCIKGILTPTSHEAYRIVLGYGVDVKFDQQPGILEPLPECLMYRESSL